MSVKFVKKYSVVRVRRNVGGGWNLTEACWEKLVSFNDFDGAMKFISTFEDTDYYNIVEIWESSEL